MGYMSWIPNLGRWKAVDISVIQPEEGSVHAEVVVTAEPETRSLRRIESDPAVYVTPPSSPLTPTLPDSPGPWIVSEKEGLQTCEVEEPSQFGAKQLLQSQLASPALGLGRMTRSVSSSLLTAGTGLVVSASQAAVRRGTDFFKQEQLALRNASTSNVESVLVHRSNGHLCHLTLSKELTLPQAMQKIEAETSLPVAQQCLSIEEGRLRTGSLLQTAQQLYLHLSCRREDIQRAVLTYMSFFTLPEAFNREMGGRGFVSWMRTSAWYQGYLENHRTCDDQAEGPSRSSRPSCKVLIEHLNGQVRMIKVDALCSVSELKAAVQRDLGIICSQQRIVVKEKAAAGPLTAASYQLFSSFETCLRSTLKTVAQATALVTNTAPQKFKATVRTSGGKHVEVTVDGETTINEIRSMVEKSGNSHNVRGIDFPPFLPPRTGEPRLSKVIHTILV